VAWTKRILAVAALTALGACGTATVVDEPDPPKRRLSAQAVLIGRVSQALDATYTAEYEWSDGGTVTMWAAEDGTWRVDVAGWAHGGEVDVSVAWTTGGFFQCADDVCVKLAGITGEIPRAYDPRVHLPFTEWLPVLLDRHSPFFVSQEGDCFTLSANTVVVSTPIPPGKWCLDQHGTILSVSNGEFGTLKLTGPPAPAAPTIELPGEIVDGEPLGRKAPEPEPTEEPTEPPEDEHADTPEATPEADGGDGPTDDGSSEDDGE
jgi:hypothetical protein